MPDTERAQRLLALFTSPECAEGIAGDLTETHGRGGSISFWRHVLATMLALCGSTFSRAPLSTLGLLTAGYFLFAASALAGVVAVRLFPQHIGPAMSWIVLSSLWWGGALCTGALLVNVAQVRGMTACVLLAIAAEALLMVFGVTVRRPAPAIPGAAFYLIAALAPLPLLTGATLVRRLLIGNATTRQSDSQ
jgi:hypothetical protein